MAKSAHKPAPKAKPSKPASKGKPAGKPVARTSAKPSAGKTSVVGKLMRAVLGSGKGKTETAKPKSKPAAAKPKARPVAAKPKSKPAVAKPKARPVAAKPKSKPAAAKPKAKPLATEKPAHRLANKPIVGKSVAKAPKPAAGKSRAAAPKAAPAPAPAAVSAVRAHKPTPLPRGMVVAKAVAPSEDAGRRAKGAQLPPRKPSVPGKRFKLPDGYAPSSKEPYMCPRHQEFFRQLLEKWRTDLVEESKQTIDNLRDEVRDVGDEAERATRETENSLELRTRDRYRKLISKIDETLRRLDDGQYGYCIDTGDEIGLERLIARPTAERTVDAQERWEHRQRQMGE